MIFAIKAEPRDPRAKTFTFAAKTMYGGKHIAKGNIIFVFASENEGKTSSRAALSLPLKRLPRNGVSRGKHRTRASPSDAPR